MNYEFLKNPHDKFFKESFGRKEVIESFIKEYLPKNIYEQLDLSSIEMLKDSWIDKELTEHFSDILYKVTIAEKTSFLYLLFEHKSYIDNLIAFQLLRNMVKIWENFRKQNKQSVKLPIIIPIIIYHGIDTWNVENSIIPLFEQIPNTKQYIPDFSSEIFDISHMPDDKIQGEVLLRVAFLAQKYIYSPQLFTKLHSIFVLLNELSSKNKATEYLEVFLRYLFAAVDSEKMPELKKELEKSIINGGSTMPTIAEKWFQEGIEKGKIEDAEKMVSMGMSNDDIKNITGLSIDKIEEICKNIDIRDCNS